LEEFRVMKFEALIEEGPGGGAYVTVPFDVEAIYAKKRVKFLATFDGIEYRGSMLRMGGPNHIIGILKEIRKTIKKDIGARVAVSVREDTDERILVLPPELEALFIKNPLARENFNQLSYTNRREMITAIRQAKKPETRQKRLDRYLQQLSAKHG